MSHAPKFKLKPGTVIMTYGIVVKIIRWSLEGNQPQYKVSVIYWPHLYEPGEIIWISKDAAEKGVILDEEAKSRLL